MKVEIPLAIIAYATAVIAAPPPAPTPEKKKKITYSEADPTQSEVFWSAWNSYRHKVYDEPSVTSWQKEWRSIFYDIPKSVRLYYTTASTYNADGSTNLVKLATLTTQISFERWVSTVPKSIRSKEEAFAVSIDRHEQEIAHSVLENVPHTYNAAGFSYSTTVTPYYSRTSDAVAHNGLAPGIHVPHSTSGPGQGSSPSESGNIGAIQSPNAGVLVAGVAFGAVGALALLL